LKLEADGDGGSTKPAVDSMIDAVGGGDWLVREEW